MLPLQVPAVDLERTSHRVVTMEFVDGEGRRSRQGCCRLAGG